MSILKQKRFWKQATVHGRDGGYGVMLDERAVNTPNKTPLIVPTLPMAEAIAAEWDAQSEKIDPLSMPVTRSANSALDKVLPQQAEVVAMLAEYGDSDLLCYRAVGPVELIAQQVAAWDGMLDWAANEFGSRLAVGEGVMHVAQEPALLANLHAEVASFDHFALVGVHDLVSISGSLILALAVTRGAVPVADAWEKSRVDEHWQASQWGDDEDASANEALKKQAFEHAERFYRLTLT
ncbi:MAG: ATPase [Yoonia sp.]|nr:ATPase [Yoonia sp.]